MKFTLSDSRRAGIKANVTTHWLRHAHASHSLDRGSPIHLKCCRDPEPSQRTTKISLDSIFHTPEIGNLQYL
jgi:hypothetical protein